MSRLLPFTPGNQLDAKQVYRSILINGCKPRVDHICVGYWLLKIFGSLEQHPRYRVRLQSEDFQAATKVLEDCFDAEQDNE